MRTTVTITTGVPDDNVVATVDVGETAQKHVLRSFNPERNVDVNAKVDVTKVLCAALIQQMIDLRDAPDTPGHMKAAAIIGIRHVENAQMHCVKANFVQA